MSSRNFNPSVRAISRLALQIPEQTKLLECSWPMDSRKCDLARQMKMVSSSVRKDNVEQYEVRSVTNEPPSVEESHKCAIGPEFYTLFKDENDVRTVVEALLDAELRAGTIRPEERDGLYRSISRSIGEDGRRRVRTLMSYAVYFAVGLYFLSDNYGRGEVLNSIPVLDDRLSQLILNLVPLLTSFYLHTVYGERVRSAGFIHILPLAILLTYFLINRVLRSGVVSGPLKTTLVLSVLAAVVISFRLVRSLRITYEECSYRQLNRRVDSGLLVLIAIFGLLVPLVLQGCSYLALPSSS